VGLTVFQIIWIASASILFVGWLVVSFTAPSQRRALVEWISATAMYTGLVTLFVSIALKAQASGNLFLLIAMGLLCVLFGGGFLVSLWHTLTALGGSSRSEQSATN
jgi:hypothetical protein